ncbi:OsmC family protein [Halovulum dunhuangense]|uniref:OsmC family protein n=1 Tax=Halovulum dunhuangense TaxID=1505036 RepID=A0A849L7N0_9RHOB|nr:OsmC family protein [Halovulum dunhuangense]NNU82051.1 OsmC family protein [Halovulum dunhuangense]
MLATDEGNFQGGEGTAPTPLEYFLTGLVGCLMTQLRVFSKKMKVPFDSLEVRCEAAWEGMKSEAGPYAGVPSGFRIDIDIQSSAPSEQIEGLVRAARLGCFVEQTLCRKNDLEYSLQINGAAE